jgi:hypothetical protein
VREPFSLKWFDYDLTGSVSFPGAYGNTDFNNRGERRNRTTDRFQYYNLGGQFQFGPVGSTLMGDVLTYDVESVSIAIARVHAVFGYSLLDNQLVVGGGVRIAYVRIAELDGPGRLSMAGLGPEVGAVIKPDDVPWRIGATLRSEVTARDLHLGQTSIDPVTGGKKAGRFFVPSKITQPWEIEAGVAYQLGPRPLNPHWLNPRHQEEELEERIAHRAVERRARARAEIAAMPGDTADELAARASRAAEAAAREDEAKTEDQTELAYGKRLLYEERKARYTNWPRERLLLLASLIVVGPSEDAVALEGFVDQSREVVGTRVQLAPRFAVESEVLPDFMRLRAGVYVEPSRFVDGTKREHFTFGGDLRTFTWDLFGLFPLTTIRMSGFVDLSPRYFNFGGGIGVWH